MPKRPRSTLKDFYTNSKAVHSENGENMRQAVEEVTKNKMTLQAAAVKYDLSKSSLHRKIKKYQNSGTANFNFARQHGFKTVFTDEEEKLLASYLIEASQMCYGLTIKETRKLAYRYAVANEKEVPQTWHDNQSAGLEWMHLFRKRNSSLALRSPEATSLSRATSFNRHNVAIFYENLRKVIEKHNLLPSQIYNCDETGVTNVHKPPKILAAVSQKQVGKVTSAERGTLITMCCAICADGTFVPPFFIFPRKNFKPHMLTGAPPGSAGSAHPTGWMTAENFVQYITHFIKNVRCNKDNPIALILDNHESHCDIRVLNICKENGIILVTLPPHCSHRLQPLDVTCYFPFKAYYNKAMDDWMLNHPGVPLTIYDIAGVVGQAFPQALTPVNIIKGFQKTGIAPFNSQIFQDSDYMCSSVTDRLEFLDTTSVSNCDENEIKIVSPVAAPSSIATKIASPVAGPSSIATKIASPVAGPSGITGAKKIVTPKEVRPHLKAGERKTTRKARKKAVSAILTDTPVKDNIEREYLEKQAKKRIKEEKARIKQEKLKKANSVKRKIYESSSSSGSDVEPQYDDSTDVNSDAGDFKTFDINVNDYILAKYVCKKIPHHYIGLVMKIEGDEIHVKFLKRLPRNRFVFPDKEDFDIISKEDILVKLPQPHVSGATERAARMMAFDIELDMYNIN